MSKYLFALALVSLLACTSYEKIPYLLPPEPSELGGEIVEPVLKVKPFYPNFAKEKGIEGWVMFEFKVDEQGQPINIKVIDSHPRGMFIPEAKSAFKKWRFSSTSRLSAKKNLAIIEFK